MRTFEWRWNAVAAAIAVLGLSIVPASGNAGAPAQAAAGEEGFAFKSADGSFLIRFRGLIQLDARAFNGDDVAPLTDTFELRRARPILEGTVHGLYDFLFVPDFAEGKTVLQDAYVDARLSKVTGLRIGKYKSPVGLEQLRSDADLGFVERGLPTQLVPNRDLGVMFHGDPFQGILSYQIGVFNGVPDGSSADLDTNSGKDAEGRVFVQPFKSAGPRSLGGFGIGIAATVGRNLGTVDSRGKVVATGLAGFRTFGQNTFFSYLLDGASAASDSVIADGRRYRYAPQIYYYAGRLGLLGEYVSSSQDVLKGATFGRLRNTSWQGTAEVLLTRDRAGYKGVSPTRPFDAASKGIGAVALAFRYGRLTVDAGAFPVFADPAKSARGAVERGAGISWYLNRGFKLMTDYVWTTFDGGGATGDREDERALFSRVQLSF
jgi:phosphate-selective porin OprO/OprP